MYWPTDILRLAGSIIVWAINDILAPQFGEDSLCCALIFVPVVATLASVAFYKANGLLKTNS